MNYFFRRSSSDRRTNDSQDRYILGIDLGTTSVKVNIRKTPRSFACGFHEKNKPKELIQAINISLTGMPCEL